MRKLIVGASLAALLAVPALAVDQDGHRRAPEPITRAAFKAKLDERFARLDANHDGVVTREEYDAARAAMKAKFQARLMQRADERFARLDTNHDGMLSKAEYDAGITARLAKWQQPREGGAPEGGPMRGRGRHGGGMGAMGGMRGGDLFARLDAGGTGRITLAEFEAKPLAMFDRADTNHDSVLTPAEQQAARQAMRGAWKARHEDKAP